MKPGNVPSYTADHIAVLATILGIGPAQHSQLATVLSHAVQTWERANDEPMVKVPAKGRSAELRKFAKIARDMQSALNDLSDAAWLSMHDGSDSHNDDHYESGIGTVAGNMDYGEAFHEPVVRLIDYPYLHHAIKGCELAQMMGLLSTTADAAASNLPDLRSGPLSDRPLAAWMQSIAFMVEDFGVPFKRDVAVDGSPVTAAARFCVAAYAVVSPITPSSRVLTAMKREITARNRKYW